MIVGSVYSWLEKAWEHRADIAGFVGLLGGAKFIIEYTRENRRKRIETYVALREKFNEDRNIKIYVMLTKHNVAADDEKVEAVRGIVALPLEERFRFAVLLEDVATRMNSGLIKPNVTAEMFGWCAIECWSNDHFWVGLRASKSDYSWSVLRDFVTEMECQKRPPFTWVRKYGSLRYLARSSWLKRLVWRIYRVWKKRPIV